VTKIKWAPFVQNHAYGVKKYILKEETYMPSMGYENAQNKFFYPQLAKLAPWQKRNVFHKVVASFEETRTRVLSTPWVKKEIEKLVQAKAKEAGTGRAEGIASVNPGQQD